MSIVWNVEGEDYLVAGAQITYSCEYAGNPVISSATAKVYQGTTDVTASLMPTGSCSISGNVVTLPKVVIPASPFREYVVVVTSVIDGNTDPRKIQLHCQKTTDTM